LCVEVVGIVEVVLDGWVVGDGGGLMGLRLGRKGRLMRLVEGGLC